MSSMASFSSLIAAAMAVDADRPAAELVDDRPQQLAIDFVEAVLVHLEQLQRGVRDVEGDGARRRAPARSRARGAAAGWRCAACRASAARSRPRRASSIGTPRIRADRRTISSRSRSRVELQPVHDAEARPQRRRQQARARRRADQRELLQRHLHRPRARPLADHDVELVVLERRIQDLLDRRRHAVDLVDEQHFALAEVRQDRRQVAWLLEHRARTSRGPATPSSLAITYASVVLPRPGGPYSST